MSGRDSIFDENGLGWLFSADTSSGYTAYAGESLKESAPADKADYRGIKDGERP